MQGLPPEVSSTWGGGDICSALTEKKNKDGLEWNPVLVNTR